jgi:hypothetical protein
MTAFYQDRDYQGRPAIETALLDQEEQRNDDLYSVGVNATYAILRTLKGTLYYTWSKRDSNVPARDFRDNIVGVGIDWAF